MPPVQTLATHASLPERLITGLRYPLHGAALATCVAIALARYLTLLPSFIGFIANIFIWIAALGFAIDCLVHTADGYAKPPEISLGDNRAGSPGGMFMLHVFLIVVLAAVAGLDGGGALTWWVMLAVIVLLPAIDMSMAFDGSVFTALNPATWMKVFARFGAAYLIPVGANIVIAIALWLTAAATSKLPVLLTVPVFGFAATWLLILDFHWMGLLVWHYRDQIGMRPEAPELAGKTRQGADDVLLAQCEALAQTDPEAAAMQLSQRIRDHWAPPPMHQLFRRLLHQLKREDLLLKHGQHWIAQLCRDNEARRALGVVRECHELDPDFVPDDSDQALELATLATRIGMRHLGSQMAAAALRRWPNHPQAPQLQRIATTP